MKPGSNSFDTLSDLDINGRRYRYYSLPKLAAQNLAAIEKLPYSLKILLENILRFEGGDEDSRGDIGAGGSDFVWNVSFILDYQFRHWGSVFIGYRWLDFDYSSGSGPDRYAYNALQQGPLAGIGFHW